MSLYMLYQNLGKKKTMRPLSRCGRAAAKPYQLTH